MGDMNKKHIEEFEKDFEKIASKGVWDEKDLCKMKDLQKIMYYMEVRDAMKEGREYPGSDYMPDDETMSFARGRNSMGQFTSGANNRGGGSSNRGRGSGTYYPPYMDQRYYDDMGSSGRRYYDDEKKNALHKLHHMMDMEENPEKKNALKIAINELEEHK